MKIKKFECVVLQLSKETFLARVHNSSDPYNLQEECEFSISLLPVTEREWLAEGAYFTWCINEDYTNEFEFTKELYLPEDIETAAKAARELMHMLTEN